MRALTVLNLVVLTLLMAGTVAFSDEPPAASAKVPVPDDAALKEAQNLVNEVYADDIAKAKTPQAKGELAKKLLQAAIETKNDAAGKYVLLILARDFAANAGDIAAAFQSIQELANYLTDAVAMKVGVLATVAKTVRGDDAHRVMERANTVIDDALAADRYDLAKQCADLALAMAKTTKDLDCIKAANLRVQEVRTSEVAYAGATKALTTLADNPDDGNSRLVVGRFYCFVKGQWKKGLPHLARGSDAALEKLAELDLASPREADKQVELGDGWWALAEREVGAPKGRVRERAGYWYEKALPALKGLVKAKAEKRVTELSLKKFESEADRVERLMLIGTWDMPVGEQFIFKADETFTQTKPGNWVDNGKWIIRDSGVYLIFDGTWCVGVDIPPDIQNEVGPAGNTTGKTIKGSRSWLRLERPLNPKRTRIFKFNWNSAITKNNVPG